MMPHRRIQAAFIVGGSSGIGLATARLLAKRGTRVAIFARGLAGLAQARKEIESVSSLGQACLAVPMDVTDPEQVRQAMTEASERLGLPDLVFSGAGQARPAPVGSIDPARFADTIALNLTGTYNVCWEALSLMRPGAHLVLVSSLAGLLGVYGYADYCAAKFGVVGLAETLRCELAPRGIKVAVLCPPDTDTPGYQREAETKPPETKALSRHGGLLSAEFVAEALLRGLRRDRFVVIPGAQAQLTALIHRLCPALVRWVMGGIVAKSTGSRRPDSPA